MNADTGHHRRCVLQAKCGQMQADIRGKETREYHELSILNPKLKNSPLFFKKKSIKKQKDKNTGEQERQEIARALIQHPT